MKKRKKILIIGAAGSIGSELTRQLSEDEQNNIYCIDINETGIFELIESFGVSGRVADIRNAETMNDVFSDFRPHIVYQAAAYKHVPLMEQLPDEAINTNILGMRNVLRYAQIYEVPQLVFISTDKAVEPKTTMGLTKALGEKLTLNAGYTVVRFGNVLYSRGSLIPIWEKKINEGKLPITDERMERYFMTIEEACDLVIEASEIKNAIVILDMGKPIKIKELAEKFVKELKGIEIENIGVRTGEQLTEKLMTDEEKQKAKKQDKFFII